MDKRNKSTTPGIIGLLLIILLLSGVLGYYLRKNDPRFQPVSDGQVTPGTSDSSVVDWDKLDMIREYVIENYDGPVVDPALLEGALKGMVGSLGQGGGEYFNDREYPDVRDRNNRTHGAGIHLATRDGSLIIISVDPGGEGEQAGVLPGDIIIRINGGSFSGAKLELAKSLMAGNENGHVELSIQRGTDIIDLNVRLRRKESPKILSGRDGDIGILRIPSFYTDMAEDFRKALDDLVAEGVKGLVLDLRNTPTGFLTEGVRVASLFIEDQNTVVSIRDTRNKIRDFVSRSGVYAELPLVVLTNGQTEGTAEFVAGALGQQEGITLVGEPTLGDGRVYSYINLPGGEGIKLASGYLLLPDGNEIHEQRIQPDIAITMKPGNNNELGNQRDIQWVRALNILKARLDKSTGGSS